MDCTRRGEKYLEEADGNSFSFFVGKPSHVSASFFLFANDLQKFR